MTSTLTMTQLAQRIQEPFHIIPDVLRQTALERGDHCAVFIGDQEISYRAFDHLVDRIAASLQRDGLQLGEVVAICAQTSIRYLAVYFGCLRAGGVVAPLPPTAKAENLDAMLDNSEARWLFIDQATYSDWPSPTQRTNLYCVAIDDSAIATTFHAWLDMQAPVQAVTIAPDAAFNLIYSSGTTGVPKGIVQPHNMRWSHVRRAWINGYRPESVVITGTPLYSNTTLIAALPALTIGSTLIMLEKFDALKYLELAQRHRATHTILVPIQYQRIVQHPEFSSFDLSSFQGKLSTSAPFSAALKADILARWPGDLTEVYGMTEGGGRCELKCHQHLDKLHTVGRPAEHCDMRIIDEHGRELPQGQTGEVVGRSPAIMQGYHKLPEKTREAEWFSPDGLRFIRTGDVGRFDEDGFLILGDRKKDMLISGGFNIYPSDLEAELLQHPAVADCAVVGVSSERWGETPVGFVVLHPQQSIDAATLLAWVNARLGKTQRLAQLEFTHELPRNAIGKVLKRELRDTFQRHYGVLK